MKNHKYFYTMIRIQRRKLNEMIQKQVEKRFNEIRKSALFETFIEGSSQLSPLEMKLQKSCQGHWPFGSKEFITNFIVICDWGDVDTAFDIDIRQAKKIFNNKNVKYYFYDYTARQSGDVNLTGVLAVYKGAKDENSSDRRILSIFDLDSDLMDEYEDGLFVDGVIEIQRNVAWKLYQKHKRNTEDIGNGDWEQL